MLLMLTRSMSGSALLIVGLMWLSLVTIVTCFATLLARTTSLGALLALSIIVLRMLLTRVVAPLVLAALALAALVLTALVLVRHGMPS